MLCITQDTKQTVERKHIMKNLFLLLILFTLSSCAQLTKHADAIKPTAKLAGMRLANINFEQVDLIFDLAVENKNPVALDLAGMDYDLKIANQSLVRPTLLYRLLRACSCDAC